MKSISLIVTLPNILQAFTTSSNSLTTKSKLLHCASSPKVLLDDLLSSSNSNSNNNEVEVASNSVVVENSKNEMRMDHHHHRLSSSHTDNVSSSSSEVPDKEMIVVNKLYDDKKHRHQEFSVQFLRKRTKLLLKKKSYQEDEKKLCNHNAFHWILDGWARSDAKDAPLQAERILERMEALNVMPNTRTYTKLLTCYARHADHYPQLRRRVLKVVRDVVAKYNTLQKDEFKPNAYLYTAAMSACANAGAANTCQTLFDELRARYESSPYDVEYRPTKRTYSALLNAWCNTADVTQAESVLHTMLEYQVKPDVKWYNRVISSYAQEGAALEAVRLVREMEELGYEPNIRTYNSALNAWSKSGEKDAPTRAEEMLKLMQSKVQPDVYSYAIVINALARSAIIGKEERAYELLHEMRENDVEMTRPNTVIYNAVLNACAFSLGNELQHQRAMEIAHRTFQELQDDAYAQPDDITFGTFFQACHNLLPKDTPTRELVLETLFRKCCAEGLVGDMVLRQLYVAANSDLYFKLLGEYLIEGLDIVAVKDVPKEWTKNVVLP